MRMKTNDKYFSLFFVHLFKNMQKNAGTQRHPHISNCLLKDIWNQPTAKLRRTGEKRVLLLVTDHYLISTFID